MSRRARVDERVVDLEVRAPGLEAQARLVLLVGRHARRGGLLGQLLHDLGGARSVESSTLTSPFWSTICPPAPAISALTHTVRPSYWLPCTSIAFPCFWASSIIWSHVLGGVLTMSLRYQSSWVLVVKAPQTLPLYSDGLERPGELALGRDLAARAGPRHDPARLGELRGPDHVHADDVDVGVLRGQAADDAARAAGSASVGSADVA